MKCPECGRIDFMFSIDTENGDCWIWCHQCLRDWEVVIKKEGHKAELHKKFIEFGDDLRDDLGLDSLTKASLINKLCRLEKEVFGNE